MPLNTIDNAITPGSLYGISEEPMYSGVLSFMRRKYTKDLSQADVAVSGIPLDLMVTNRPGTRFGPAAIRKASASPGLGTALALAVRPLRAPGGHRLWRLPVRFGKTGNHHRGHCRPCPSHCKGGRLHADPGRRPLYDLSPAQSPCGEIRDLVPGAF